jgi:hypothetical protein
MSSDAPESPPKWLEEMRRQLVGRKIVAVEALDLQRVGAVELTSLMLSGGVALRIRWPCADDRLQIGLEIVEDAGRR